MGGTTDRLVADAGKKMYNPTANLRVCSHITVFKMRLISYMTLFIVLRLESRIDSKNYERTVNLWIYRQFFLYTAVQNKRGLTLSLIQPFM
jgi:hypothetical protein